MDDNLQPTVDDLWEYILSQTHYHLDQVRRAVTVLLCGQAPGSGSLARPPHELSYADLERCAGWWANAIPNTPPIQAALARRLAAQYALVRAAMPRTWQALGLESAAVMAAHQQIYQQPLDSLFSATPPPHPPSPPPPVDWITLEDLQALENALERVRLTSGEVLCNEGECGEGMYVITSGLIQVVRGAGSQRQVIAERGRDELLGEMALLTGEARVATLVAVRDTELFRISKETFDRLVRQYPLLTLAITRMIAQRLAASTRGERPSEVAATIAILPAGRNADLATLVASLQRTLSKHGAVLHLDSRGVDDALFPGAAQTPAGGALEERLIGWLNECEDHNDFVLFQADAEMSEWTRRCIRQADRVLLVGMGNESPEINASEAALFNSGEFNPALRKELVLLHPHYSQLPHGTAAWLQERPVNHCYHLALDNPTHPLRLVRYLSGQPVALVLSGGGFRGLAHIGVLRALREAGVPVDAICAASAGALVGSVHAMGKDDREMESLAEQLLRDTRLLADYTLPLASMVAGERLIKLLKRLYGDTCIEDLWLQFMCTSTDLTSATLQTHRRGPVHRYVRASSSVPALLPPVLDGQHLLVDGGLMNNLPVNQLLEVVRGGKLILVNVSKAFYNANANYNYGESLPFWKVINGRFNPFAEKLVLPSITQVLLRCFEIGSKSSEPAQIAKVDLYIRPQVEHISYDQVVSIADVIRAGYLATQKALEDCPQRAKFSFEEAV
jgi:predicted acylesterase/phospholipase RssA/CRP-like cAMP-binding protein